MTKARESNRAQSGTHDNGTHGTGTDARKHGIWRHGTTEARCSRSDVEERPFRAAFPQREVGALAPVAPGSKIEGAMKKLILLICTGLPLVAFAQTHPLERPHITGIDHVSFYTTAPDGVKKLYVDILGLPSAAPIESGETVRYMSGKQWVGYSPAPDAKATDRMDHVAFTTDNIGALRRYLVE